MSVKNVFVWWLLQAYFHAYWFYKKKYYLITKIHNIILLSLLYHFSITYCINLLYIFIKHPIFITLLRIFDVFIALVSFSNVNSCTFVEIFNAKIIATF